MTSYRDEPLRQNDESVTTYDGEESEQERLNRNWDELLQELRITQTGLQLLSGFLLTLPFTQVFRALDGKQEMLYLALVVISAAGVGANMTPIMMHRRVFRQGAKDQVVKVGHVMVQVVMAAVALLIVGMALLIFSVVLSWTEGIIVGVALSILLVIMLAVAPSRLNPR